MAANLTLVTNQPLSHDTVECLQQLLASAQAGHLIGIAFAAMYRGRFYAHQSTGECRSNPVFARGMVAALDDQLGELARYGDC